MTTAVGNTGPVYGTPNTFGPNDSGTGTLNGLFKEVYADKMKDLIPDGVKLLNLIRFSSKEKSLGNLFHCPIILGMEHGVTFASSDADAFNLNPAVAGSIKDAQVRGAPMVLRSVLGYVAASRAQAGKEAFMDATKFLVSNMLRSISKKLEIEMLYGQAGYGDVASFTAAVVGPPAVPAYVTIKTAEWAPGIWAGAENMPIEFVAGGALTGVTATVVKVDLLLRRVYLTVSGGTPAANDSIYHKGAFGAEFVGVHQILKQSSSTLFNIDVAQYNLFKGSEYDAAGAALSFTKLNLAVARAVEKGLDSKVTALVNPRAWANMLQDQASLRRYDSSWSTAEVQQGSKSIKFFSQNGEIEIVPSIYVKEGYAYLIAVDDWSRVGSSDITFKRPGKEGDFFRDLENSAGYELRCMTDQALFCNAPGRSVIITGIVNAA